MTIEFIIPKKKTNIHDFIKKFIEKINAKNALFYHNYLRY